MIRDKNICRLQNTSHQLQAFFIKPKLLNRHPINFMLNGRTDLD